MLTQFLREIQNGVDLTADQMAAAIGVIMEGSCAEAEIAAFLTALRSKGETVDEVVGAARAMRSRMSVIQGTGDKLLDTCGTGGDASHTFNISTAAAIVAAATGVRVAKHGNRGMSSKSGSADVLRALGVNVEATVAQVERCLNETGLCFCFAPLFHQSMKHVAQVRRMLGTPTIFNILGPLCNPARAPWQLLGCGREELADLLAQALLQLGVERAAVVRGEDGLDEVSLARSTRVTVVADGACHRTAWSPGQFGVQAASLEQLTVASPDESADVIRSVLQGCPGPARDIVVLNAAAAIWVTDPRMELSMCARRAAQAIDDGLAREKLARLVQASHG